MTNNPHIFISYSTRDLDLMLDIYQDLRTQGLRVWIDKQGIITGAASWRTTIQQAIEEADCVVVLLSPHAKKSYWVQQELDYAQLHRKQIYAVLLHGTEQESVPFGFAAAQWVDIRHQYELIEARLFPALASYLQVALPMAGIPSSRALREEVENIQRVEEYTREQRQRAEAQAAVKDERDAAAKIAAEAEALRKQAQQEQARLYTHLEAEKTAAVERERQRKTEEENERLRRELEMLRKPVKSPSPPSVGAQRAAPNPSLDLADLTRRTLEILPPPFDWCYIPAGKATIEYSDTDKKEFSIDAFAIAKYPVTNAQFEAFVKAKDGYANAQWWDYSEDAQAWRSKKSKPEDTGYDGDDLPRTKVTWYESIAFCRWLSARLNTQIILPTEQEWQRAAQGDDGRVYPWGTEFEPKRCNTRESSIKRPTPVTQYPNGASPYGVFDMSGNVWEWCLTTGQGDKTDLSGSEARVLRGGSFYGFQNSAAASYRDYDDPDFDHVSFGLRVVCVPL